jgi:DNA-binding GntR family transcriptional regulator
MSIERKLTTQEIYESLRKMIIDLDITPGARLTEGQLADHFQVSRTPVRAVLQRLESEGFLTIKSKQGCFIRNLDMEGISQYYDVRVALENLVLEEIHRKKNHDELQLLAELWFPETLTWGIKASEDLKAAEENFHYELAKIAQNNVLLNYIMDINDQIRVVRSLGWPNTQSVMDTYAEHYRICEMLLSGDIESAKFEMTNHIRKSQDQASRITLHQIYGNRKFL